MSQTIVVLLILFIIDRITNTNRVLKTSSKESGIEYYEQQLKIVRNRKLSNTGLASTSLFVVFVNIVAIYYAIQSIISLVK